METLGIIVKVDGTLEASNGLKLTGQGATDLGNSLDTLGQKTNTVRQAHESWRNTMQSVAVATRATSDSSIELSSAAQKILDRFDPLGTKLRSLNADMAVLRREMGGSSSPAAFKSFQGLEEEIIKTKSLMITAGAAGTEGFSKVAAGADKAMFATARARRELFVLGREALTGNFASMPGSFAVLASSMDLTAASFARLLGPVGAIGGVVLGLGALGIAAFKGAQEERKLNDSLTLTGNFAGLAAGQLDEMASSLARGINGGVRDSREILAGLTATGKFTVQSLQQVGEAAQLVARFSGQSSAQVVRQFGSMADGVAKWAAKANESYHFLDIATFRYITQLEKQGRVQEAVLVASQAVSEHLGGDMTKNLGALEKLWESATTAVQGYKQALLGIGKDKTIQDQIAELEHRLEIATTGPLSQSLTSAGDRATAREVSGIQAQLAALRGTANQEKENLAGISAREQAAEKEIELAQRFGKIQEQNLSRIEKMNKALAEARASGAAAGASESEIKILEDRIRGRFADKTSKRAPAQDNQAETFLAGLQAQLRAASGEASTYATVLERLDLKTAKFNATQRETALALASQIDAQKKLREITQIREKNDQAAAAALAAQQKEVDGLVQTNEALRAQIVEVGLTKEKMAALRLERLDGVIAMQRENLVVQQGIEGNEAKVALLEREINLLEQQRGLSQTLNARTAEADKASAAQDAATKFGEEIRSDLKDGIIRGFEDGKGPLKAFGDTLGNIVRQRLLSSFADSILNGFEPLIKQVMSRIGTASAGGGGLLRLVGGVVNGLLGGSGNINGGGFGTGDAFGNQDLGAFLHGGGVVGGEATFRRPVSAAIFKGAPRMHSGGIAGNEVPIIAKRGEGVFTQQQMAALAPVGAGAAQAPVINIFTPPGTQASTRSRQTQQGLQVDVIINALDDALGDRVNSGTGALFGALGGRFGLQTSVN